MGCQIYFEVELVHTKSFAINVGVCRPSVQAMGLQPSFGDSPDGDMHAYA